MPTFQITARNRRGETLREQRDASSAAALGSALRAEGLLVLSIEAADGAPRGGGGLTLFPVRGTDIELGLQQLAVMLRSGLTLLMALETTAEQARRPSAAALWRQVAARIEGGSSFADALAEHDAMPDLTVQLVRVGEQTGQLEIVLVRAAEAMERHRGLRGQVLTTLMYPAIVLILTFAVTAFLLIAVVPKIERFLTALGKRLPPMTRLLLDISAWLQAHIIAATVIPIALGLSLYAIRQWPPGRLATDAILLRIPLLGRALRLGHTALFARSLALLMRSGITLLEALHTTEALLPNRALAELVGRARGKVMGGESFAASLAGPGGWRVGFTPMLPRMAAVGESAGTLPEVLDEVARFHESELDVLIRRLSTIIEPLIIILVGGIVGFVYVSVFVALYSAAGGSR